MDQPAHEGAGTEHDRAGAVDRAVRHADAGDAEIAPLPFRYEVIDGLLPQAEIRLFFAEAFDFTSRLSCRPGARPVHGGAFAAVEHAELDAGGVDGRPIAPPKASISRTICPLATPPMAGLQPIWPMVSRFVVKSAVRAPMRAAAKAASVPACPPPITKTS